MTEDWIKKRMQGIETRNNFTDELRSRGIEKGIEFAMITNKTYKVFGDEMNAENIRVIKGLTKQDNIRDNMTDMEVQLTQMTEATAKTIIQGKNAEGFNAIGECVDTSVEIMNETREKIELASGTPMLSSHNNLSDQQKEKRKQSKRK
ncbi:hypothetical protein FACS189428_2520 [Clostridia bacterium]|nr:hypothetical protein FACS189428_2520 [Clostridia bacterium]